MMNKIALFFITIFCIGLSKEGFTQNPATASTRAKYSTEKIKKDGTFCKISMKDGKERKMHWSNSPCEKMYGQLPSQ